MHTLKSELHMSEAQAQGAIIGVANILVWEKGLRQVCDYNTLPAATNTNRTEPYIEAKIISGIVNEIMEEDADVTVTYSNDGSAMNRVGNYIVQSFNINGKQRALPTLSIFGESRENLKDLEVFTLNMLSAKNNSWKNRFHYDSV